MPLEEFPAWKQWSREMFHYMSLQMPMQLQSKQAREHLKLAAGLGCVVHMLLVSTTINR